MAIYYQENKGVIFLVDLSILALLGTIYYIHLLPGLAGLASQAPERERERVSMLEFSKDGVVERPGHPHLAPFKPGRYSGECAECRAEDQAFWQEVKAVEKER